MTITYGENASSNEYISVTAALKTSTDNILSVNESDIVNVTVTLNKAVVTDTPVAFEISFTATAQAKAA